jgi:ABC-type multidrug transport system fused ATPase/permease subunit
MAGENDTFDNSSAPHSSTKMGATRTSPSSSLLRYLIVELIGPHQKILYASIFLGILSAAAQPFLFRYVQVFFDKGLIIKDAQKIVQLSALLVPLFFGLGLIDFYHRFLMRRAVEEVVRDLRQRIFRKILIFSESGGKDLQSGKALTHVISDVHAFGVGMVHGIDVIREPLVIVGIVSFLFFVSWKLTLVAFFAIALLPLIGGRLAKSARRNHTRYQESIERISSHTMESLRGRRTALSFGKQKDLLEEFREKNTASFGFQLRLARSEEAVNPLTKGITAIVGACILGYAGWLHSLDQLSIGEFLGFAFAAGQLQGPLKLINQSNVRMQQCLATGARLKEFLDLKLDAIGEAQDALLLHPDAFNRLSLATQSKETLSFHDISFSYPSREVDSERPPRPALSGINLELAFGRKLALVGRSGSGKTTLSLLALRFLDPQKGRIVLGTKDARDWNLQEYRNHFSYVSQDVFLFQRSIRENFLIAKPQASDLEIWTALEKAAIRDFVDQLPAKLDTRITELASTLSGGERQRMALARAFLRDSPILILDEATSQLDAHSEAIVQKTMKSLMQNRSVLLIAHRLSTVKEADEILVFDEGLIVERGTPRELLAREGGHFRELWNSQFEAIGS